MLNKEKVHQKRCPHVCSLVYVRKFILEKMSNLCLTEENRVWNYFAFFIFIQNVFIFITWDTENLK